MQCKMRSDRSLNNCLVLNCVLWESTFVRLMTLIGGAVYAAILVVQNGVEDVTIHQGGGKLAERA